MWHGDASSAAARWPPSAAYSSTGPAATMLVPRQRWNVTSVGGATTSALDVPKQGCLSRSCLSTVPEQGCLSRRCLTRGV
eukprot:107350-Chlamydomonas_euryale.AAC.11